MARPHSPVQSPPNQHRWAYLALGFTTTFLLLHLYWASGGHWGLPLAALQRPSTVQAANWIVSAIMLLGLVWIFVLVHPIGRRLPAWLVLSPLWAGAVICLSHAVFGFITKTLYLSGLHGAVHFPVVNGVSPAVAAAHNHLSSIQDLIVFEPSFMLEGALLALAAQQYIRTVRGRRIWVRTITAGVALICLLGALLVLLNRRVAIS